MSDASVSAASSTRRDLLWLGLGLLAVLAWDASGQDLAAARLFGSASGFALREDPALFWGLHELPRFIGWGLLAGLFVGIGWPVGVLRRLSRAERVWLAVATLAAVVAVSVLKGTSSTSCPWDLAAFGGRVPYVSHWAAGVFDGGGGHCFPAGHASAAFAWVAGVFAFRARHPRVALAWGAAAVVLGFVLGLAQQVRGAHFMSHTLWTAWICWVVAWVLDGLWRLASAPARERAEERVHGHA